MSDSETLGYCFNHTMLRIRDPETSIEFYEKVLGMTNIRRLDFKEWEFSLYFFAHINDQAQVPSDGEENAKFTFGRSGVLELTHNWGTEDKDENPYHDGNSSPQGFGHICISVPDIKAACDRFERLGVEFKKRLEDGNMKNIAFIKDPDGYWIEIVQPDLM